MPAPTVAIIGASADRTKFGNKAVRAHVAQGYQVFPINPRGGQIEGLPVYRRLADLPYGRLQRISLYVPPAVGISLLDSIAERGCDELWLNPGSESPELVAAATALGLNPIQACSIVALGSDPQSL